MRTIGLIGGITPQSTVMYYEILNNFVAKHYGGKHSCKVVIHSLDFGEIHELQGKGRWDLLDVLMEKAGTSLEGAGADCILICANTMHLCIDAVRKAVSIPVIHIAEATAEKILEKKLKTIALLGTKYTMEKDFYKAVLTSFGIKTLIPNATEREEVNRVIYFQPLTYVPSFSVSGGMRFIKPITGEFCHFIKNYNNIILFVIF